MTPPQTRSAPRITLPGWASGGGAARAWSRLNTAKPISRSELALAGALLGLLGIAVFGSHVLDGGFYYDDWEAAATAQSAADPGIVGVLGAMLDPDVFVGRPGVSVLLALTHEVFGIHMGFHLATALAVGIFVAFSFYALLRTLGLEPVHAGAIAALVLVFPWADATKLWASLGLGGVAIASCLWGAVVALRAFQARGRRALVLHVAATVLFAVSVVVYEATAPFVLLSVLLYAYRFSWRRALRRWPADVAVVAGGLMVVLLYGPRTVYSLADDISHAARMADQAVALLGRTIAPFATPSSLLVLAVVVAVLLAGIARLRTIAPEDRAPLRRWLLVCAAAVVAIAAGYVMFVPSEGWYLPLQPGHGNRTNALASLGLVALAYGLVMVVAALLMRDRGRQAACGAIVAALIAVGYVVRVDDDKEQWQRAFEAQQGVLAGVKRALPNPSPNAHILTFGHPAASALNVPVFVDRGDLTGALQVAYGESSLNGAPVYQGARLSCGKRSVILTWYENVSIHPYASAIFVEPATGRVTPVRHRRMCRAAVATFVPGPSLIPAA